MTNPSPEWSEERVALLRQLNPIGTNAWIALEINARTGSSFTRNAIIGKRNRLKLPAYIGVKQSLPRKPRKSSRPRVVKVRLRKPTAKALLEMFATVPPPGEFLGLRLWDLENDQCRYPRGENPTRFCGQPVKPGSSYCPHCHSICHEAKGEKNADRRNQPSQPFAARGASASEGFTRKAGGWRGY